MTETHLKESINTSKSYTELLLSLREKIRSSQIKAAVSVNVELTQLYWEIGIEIVEKQEKEGWGTKVIDRLAKDLKDVFPGMKGFSSRNLFYMKQFAEAYPETEILQQAAAKIPWGPKKTKLSKK